jgi:hypothetical protein
VNRLVAILIASTTVCLAACGSSSSPTAVTSTSTSTTPATPVQGCQITEQAESGPLLSNPQSPYFDHLGVAQAVGDGATAASFREALSHASAGDLTRLPDGSIGLYYHNGSDGGAVWLARLNGSSLSPVGAITVDGVARPRWIADPNADLINGRVRLTYLNGQDSSRRKFCMAESTDGQTFTTRALAITFNGDAEADPSLAQMSDGSWLMAFSRGNHTGLGLARSSDGLTFSQFFTSSTMGVVPELTALSGGRVRMYACQGGNVLSHVSNDGGSTWSVEGTVIARSATGRAIVCDPTFLQADQLFVFKVTDAM